MFFSSASLDFKPGEILDDAVSTANTSGTNVKEGLSCFVCNEAESFLFCKGIQKCDTGQVRFNSSFTGVTF